MGHTIRLDCLVAFTLSYFAFSSTAKRTSEKSLTHEELLEASLQDIFDALSMQDHLDGGISVLIQCAGSEAVASPENLPVDLYITPHELQETPERIGGDLAVWVQLLRLISMSRAHSIYLAQWLLLEHIYNVLLNLAHTFTQELKATAVHDAPSAAIRRGAEMSEGTRKFSHLARALLADLQGMPRSPGVVKPSSVLMSILKLIGPSLIFAILLWVMVSQSFYAVKCIQAPPRSHPKVTLSKEARAALKFQRTKKSRQFKDALDLAWAQIDDVTTTIAATHCKSFHRVQHDLYMGRGSLHSKHSKPSVWNTFCWKKSQEAKKENCNGHGKEALQSLVRDHKNEYHALTQEEQQGLLQEFADQKETKLNSLNSRTGAEVMLYMTRGTTDLPLHAITFTMLGVNHFMDSVIGIDTQDFLSKMEGFAIQGIQGAASNHQKEVSKLCGDIRAIITQKLRKVTGESNARMQWADYFRNVVNHYQVAIKGWPEHIPFTNLSSVTNALLDLHILLDCWKSGDTRWEVLDDEELEQLRRKRHEKIDSGDIIESHRRTRCSKKHKSAETIESSDDEDTQSHGQTPDASEDVNTTSNANLNSNTTGCTAGQTSDGSENVSTTPNANSNSNMTRCTAGQTPDGSEDVNTTPTANLNSNTTGCTAKHPVMSIPPDSIILSPSSSTPVP
ncbi:hypothetical protein EV424DRAFT_1341295 [Suillus variegatus]|nr:hypothetical protein EV424DRAFT_1341295 [Suillus variegatus]